MSGIVGSKLNIRGSERIAKLGTDGQVLTSAGAGVAAAFEDIAAGISWQSVVTGSTLTAVAGNGYWIDTSSNACTITLPSSASVGDTIVFADYARNWGTNGIELDSNGLNYQSQDDTYTVEYATDGTALRIVYMDATQGWIPTLDEAVADVPFKGNDEGILGFGWATSALGMTNLVSNTGVVGSDVSAVGTVREDLAATQFGGDKGIFGFGWTGSASSLTNLVSNTGVVASDVTGVGTARGWLGACSYGGDKGLFGFGNTSAWSGWTGVTNLVSNVGVVASDTAAVGTGRGYIAACEYGGDKGIFAMGYNASWSSSVPTMSNKISNTGVVASDTATGNSSVYAFAACSYGKDKGIFGFGVNYGGTYLGTTQLVSNTGVIGSDVAAVGTARSQLAACEFGGDQGIFAYGWRVALPAHVTPTNIVSNLGVIASDVTGVGTTRRELAACSFN